jgi:hypothetical protein
MPAIEARLRAKAHIAKGGVDPEQAELRRELEATRRTVTMLQACIPIPPGRCMSSRPRLSMFRPERHDRAGRQDVFQSVWRLWTFVLPSCVCSPLRLRLGIGARARCRRSCPSLTPSPLPWRDRSCSGCSRRAVIVSDIGSFTKRDNDHRRHRAQD